MTEGNTGGYTVETDKLDAHRADVEEAVKTADRVVDAGHQVTPGGWDNAFGLMFQAFPVATHPIAEAFIDFAKTASQALQYTSTALGTAAVDYQRTEQHTADILHQLEKKIADVSEMQVGNGALPPEDVAEPHTPVIGAPAKNRATDEQED
ncbi:hypothetical protein [Amycolatopsis jiangsuensis]|uniref:Excreted virulence factor EspC (Type VII ESX diderm) n=1 Tax=Amycolatopsis jiangsuensis TaxID=1181879 RepID=A0A840J7N6_9PSEU|nr:hypothetical protein [Amycolatopsis jiangsuensis]MBB4689464.1 hypothetical protein [Amycolatopsis jiangsuensis]